jgi:hypothetical protein
LQRESPPAFTYAVVAQLAEHFHGKEGVRGPNPRNGSKSAEVNNLKKIMKNSTKSILLIVLILVAAVLIYYRIQQDKKNAIPKASSNQTQTESSLREGAAGDQSDATDDNFDQIDQEFETTCQSGQWKKIADVSGDAITLSGKLRKVYSEDDISPDLKNFSYYIEGKTNTALSGSNLTGLDLFEDRAVEVQGVKSQDGKSMDVFQLRCSGAETDKTAIDARTNLLNWLGENINAVTPQKAPYQKWSIDTVDFIDQNNAYIEYYDMAEDDENADISEDTSRKILLEISAKGDGGYEVKVLAYWEMGDDDYVLKTGTDKFVDTIDEMDTMMYQYDSEEKSWTRI